MDAMKLIYTKWNNVKKFLRSMDEPLGEVEFQIIIRTKWQNRDPLPGEWVYEVEIPAEMIT